MNGEIAVAISAAAALLGTWLGSSLTSRHEDRRWERQERLNAYSAFMSAADEWHRATTDLWVSDRTLPSYAAVRTLFSEKLGRVDLTADRVKLIGSDAIRTLTNDVMFHFVARIMTLTVQEPRVPDAEWYAAASTGYNTHMRAFLEAARLDLTATRKGFTEKLQAFAVAAWRSLLGPSSSP